MTSVQMKNFWKLTVTRRILKEYVSLRRELNSIKGNLLYLQIILNVMLLPSVYGI